MAQISIKASIRHNRHILQRYFPRGKGEAIKPFIDYVRETGIIVIETTFLDFVEAITEMGKHNLDYKIWDDLIISCQMRRNEVQEIYTDDKDFEKIEWVKPVFP